MTRTTFYTPPGETILDEIKKLIGRQSLSAVIIDALKLFKQNATGGNVGSVSLPDWRIWMKYMQDIKAHELIEFSDHLKHLLDICNAQREYLERTKPKEW